MDTESQIRAFIIDSFLFGTGGERLSASDSLIAQGVIDSTGVLELVSFVEQTYEFQVEDAELTPENFDSIEKLVQFVRRKSQSSGHAQPPSIRAA